MGQVADRIYRGGGSKKSGSPGANGRSVLNTESAESVPKIFSLLVPLSIKTDIPSSPGGGWPTSQAGSGLESIVALNVSGDKSGAGSTAAGVCEIAGDCGSDGCPHAMIDGQKKQAKPPTNIRYLHAIKICSPC